jgi:hypothetical protein
MFQDKTYSSPTMNNIEILMKNPQVIQGDYQFTLFNMDGTIGTTTNNGAATDKLG